MTVRATVRADFIVEGMDSDGVRSLLSVDCRSSYDPLCLYIPERGWCFMMHDCF
jgi:hypothetical protein